MNINELKIKTTLELIHLAKKFNIHNLARSKKQEIIFSILNEIVKTDENIYINGILEIIQDGFGFIRYADSFYTPGHDDVYVSSNQIKKFSLRTGDEIKGKVRPPRNSEKYFSLLKIDEINNETPILIKKKITFENLTPVHVCDRFILEIKNNSYNDLTSRIIDIITPIGKGQRALLVSPPKTGKTVILQNIAASISVNHKDCFLFVLLIDERPEEVTEIIRSVKGEIIASTFDEPVSRHIQVAEIVIEKAKRLVEHKRDVIIFLDSITRLARAYNALLPSSGKVLTGGVESSALQRPKRLFGSARNTEEGGSLTIIATALVDTGSKMDEIIFEEFKGTGNLEIHLDKELSEKKIYPSIKISKSGTRREELIVNSMQLQKIWILRRMLNPTDDILAMENFITNLKTASNNEIFLNNIKENKE